MSTFLVTAKEVRIPGLCVACGAPTEQGLTPAQRRQSSLEVSGYTRQGNRVFSEKMSFPLCRACADARSRIRLRSTAYPGRRWTISLGLLSFVAGVGWIIGVENAPSSGRTDAVFVLFLVTMFAAIWLSRRLRRRNDFDHPPSEDDLRRLALMGEAGSISVGANAYAVTSVNLTLNNETFSEAFAALNPEMAAVAWTAFR